MDGTHYDMKKICERYKIENIGKGKIAFWVSYRP